jgi:hypothetical protein
MHTKEAVKAHKEVFLRQGLYVLRHQGTGTKGECKPSTQMTLAGL